MKLKKIIRKCIPYINYLPLIKMRISQIIKNDEVFIRERYRNRFGRDLNLENPKSFNEKIQYRTLKDRNNIYTQLTDKYNVRNYVKKKIGEKYLTKLYGVYESVKDINYDKLPNKFVLKCTHDSGSVIICNDKSKINKKSINRKLRYFIKRNFYYATREYHYKDINPRIICEEFIGIGDKPPIDYKFHVFNDKNDSIIIQCDEDRFESHKRSMYDQNWNKLDFRYNKDKSESIMEKPKNLDEMISIAKKLAEGFDYIRVDLYLVEDKIYFGELTFTPEGGMGVFEPEIWDYKLGELWNINRLNSIY